MLLDTRLVNDSTILIAKLILLCGAVLFFGILRHRVLPLYRLRRIVGFYYPTVWVLATLLVGLALYFGSQAVFGQFIGFTVNGHQLRLDYSWPMRDVIIQADYDTDVTSRVVGNGRRAKIVVSHHGNVYFGSPMLRSTSDMMAIRLKSHLEASY